jgi:hypothetical protein
VVEFKQMAAEAGADPNDSEGKILTMAEAEQLYQRVLALHREVEELGRELATRTAQRDALRQATVTEQPALEQEVQTLRQEVARWQSEAEALRREKEQLAAHCDGFDQAARKAEKAYLTDIKNLREALERSQLEAQDASRRNSELLAQFQALWNEHRQQQASVDSSPQAETLPEELASIHG